MLHTIVVDEMKVRYDDFEVVPQKDGATLIVSHTSVVNALVFLLLFFFQDELLRSLPVRRPSVYPSVRPFTHLSDFSSEISWPNFFKVHVEPCVIGGFKICTNGHGPEIKMAALPIYSSHRLIMGKTLKKSFSQKP